MKKENLIKIIDEMIFELIQQFSEEGCRWFNREVEDRQDVIFPDKDFQEWLQHRILEIVKESKK